ncbi:MAG: tetratricopeptide repeat protein [Armatimonadota bacterium]
MNDSEHTPDVDRSLDAQIAAHKIETLVRTANIHVMRGQLADALSACQEALALEPDHPDVRELIGDILAQQGKQQAAIAEYRAVFEAHPDRITAERKIAELSLHVGEQQRLLDRQRELVEDPTKREQSKDRTHVALLSSILLPGLGQLCLGAYFKGAALLVLTLALLYFIVNKVVLEPLSTLVGQMAGSAGGWRGAITHFIGYSAFTKVLLLGACLLVLGCYAYGIVDTWRITRAQQDQRDRELGIA